MSPYEASLVDRRGFLEFAAVAAVPLCCITPELPRSAFTVENGVVRIALSEAPELRSVGTARAIVYPEHQLNLIVVYDAEQSYVALDRSCTHGGAQCAYNHRRHTLRCTSLNHAEYTLKGTLLHGRTHGNLKAYPTRLAADLLEIRFEGAV